MKWNITKTAAVMAAAAAVIAMTACGNQFKASPDMAGGLAPAESIENLEKLDEKKTEAFLAAVNKKYDVEVKDCTAEFSAEGAVDLELDEILGSENDAAVTMKIGGAAAGNKAGSVKFTDLDVALGIPVLGDLSMKCDSYTDKAAKESYTMMKEFKTENGLFELFGADSLTEDLNKWTKSEIKETGEQTEEEKALLKLVLDHANVNGVYMDKNTGAYIVDMKMEGFNGILDKEQLKDPENASAYMTYDKGLALCGIYAKADNVTLDAALPEAEAKAENTSEPTELKFRDFMFRVDFKALNSDPDLSVPEEVKSAAVEGSSDNALDMLSDLSDMFS